MPEKYAHSIDNSKYNEVAAQHNVKRLHFAR